MWPFLLATTALLVPALALAQMPEGGRVVAGSATITQSGARTQVNQSTDRAVIEWNRFNLGASHRVDIRQPASSSWSLQRVTGGDPSSVAGRLSSNGGIALVNPAGILFQNGAQVDVASLIATTADTANTSFMAGRMAFDTPGRPGARVENRGEVTVAERGLAALVAPQVANSGTIRARLGRVALAGGEAFALDLAGDGLIALDVTRQVTQAGGAAALVTNTGTVEAAGGHVTLTARAASGLLETLVEAGGRVTAPGGTVEVTAPGGGVRVPAGATLETAGGAAGGRITVGAGAESRIGAPARLSARTTVERGATVRAGRGGTAIIHAESRTAMHGTVEAEAGAIEVSSRGALALDGEMRAPGGTVLVDPEELRIVASLSGSTEPAEITAAAVNATTGALTLQANRAIRVAARVDKTQGPLTLETTNSTAVPGDGIRVDRPLHVAGDLMLLSAGDITQAAAGAAISAGTLVARSTAGAVRLDAGANAIRALAGGAAATRFDVASNLAMSVDGAVAAPDLRIATTRTLSLSAPVGATGTAELVGLRGITQAGSGAGVTAGTLLLEAPLGAIALTGTGNRVANLGDTTAPNGMSLRNETALNIAGTLNGGAVALTAVTGDLTQDPAASRVLATELSLAAPGGSVILDGARNSIPRLRGTARDDFIVDAGGSLTLAGAVAGTVVDLRTLGDLEQAPGATITAGTLRVNAPTGSVVLDTPGNAVVALGDAGAGVAFTLATAGTLSLNGALNAPRVTLVADTIVQGVGGSITAAELRATALTGDVLLTNAANAVDSLGPAGAARDFALRTGGALAVTGALDAGSEVALDAASIRLAAPLVSGSIALTARAGDLTQNSGRLTAARLTAGAAGTVRLDAAGNALAAVSGRAGTGFRIATAGDLLIEGLTAPEVVLAGRTVTQSAAIETDLLAVEARNAVGLANPGNAIRALGVIRAPGGLTLATRTALLLTAPVDVPSAVLEIGGDLTQMPGAPLAAGTLRLSAGGAVMLEDGANAIPRLLGASATGDLRLVTSTALRLEGPTVATGTLALTAGGDLTQATTGAGLTAATLAARSLTGRVALAGAGNRFAALGSGGAAGSFALAHEGAEPLRLIGTVAAPDLALTLASGLVQEAGALRTDSLTLASDGLVRLDGPGDRIGAIAGRAAGLVLATEGGLLVTGPLDIAGRLALSAGTLGLLAPVAASGGALLVASAGDITQAANAAGLRVEGGLEAYASGAVALAGAGNAVPLVLGGAADAGFALASDGALTLRGALSGETIALRAAGPLTLDAATLTAGRAALIAAPGGLEGNGTTRLLPLAPARLPALLLDTRRANGLTAVPGTVRADVPGLANAAQATQLAAFGPASSGAAAGAVFDLAAGFSPVFLLLDGGAALGVIEAGRLGVLGRGGSAFVVGTLGGTGGEGAAALVAVAATAPGYRFNQCPMGLANCGAPPPVTPEVPVVPVAPAIPVLPVPPVAPVIPVSPAIPVTPVAPIQPPADPIAVPGTVKAVLQARPESPAPWFAWPPPWPLPPSLRVEE